MDMVAGGATKGMAVGAVLSAERRRPVPLRYCCNPVRLITKRPADGPADSAIRRSDTTSSVAGHPLLSHLRTLGH